MHKNKYILMIEEETVIALSFLTSTLSVSLH